MIALALILVLTFSAAKEIRTPTPFRALPPQGSASTNFAIAAFDEGAQLSAAKIIFIEQKIKIKNK